MATVYSVSLTSASAVCGGVLSTVKMATMKKVVWLLSRSSGTLSAKEKTSSYREPSRAGEAEGCRFALSQCDPTTGILSQLLMCLITVAPA